MSQEESDNCRYCLEILDCENGDIFDPCKCKSKVHKNCFIHWLLTRPFDPTDEQSVLSKCEICKSRYKRRYMKYVKDVFDKRSLMVQIRSILYRQQYNQHNHTTDSTNNCFMVWFGLFFCMLLIISLESNYKPEYTPNGTLEYNNTF